MATKRKIDQLEATVVHQRKRTDTAEQFICMMCAECTWEEHGGLIIMQKACCSFSPPECGKFKYREGWIPVSEGLPHFSPGKWRKVIVTMEDDSGKRFTTTAIYNEKQHGWYAFADRRYEKFKVIAWRLKPEVYDGN